MTVSQATEMEIQQAMAELGPWTLVDGKLHREYRLGPNGYGIPYRSIVPKGVDGLLVVGKAMSGSHIAMSAYRVMPIVGAVGQSAGVAAALCARRKPIPG